MPQRYVYFTINAYICGEKVFKNMKKAHFTLLTAAALTIQTACRNTSNAPVEESHQNEYETPDDQPTGIQRMNTYDFTDTVVISGHTYIYNIHREASDSLPTVSDDFGTSFADNIYHINIRRDGGQFYSHSFTKAAFVNMLTAEMKKHGVLDGMRCDTTLDGLCFAASISQPQSDLYQPFIITVAPDASTAITRDTRDEMDLNTPAE